MVTLRINFKEKTILRIKIDEEEDQKDKERAVVKKRKQLDGEIDEGEEEHKERRAVVKKRKQLDGERGTEIDEERAIGSEIGEGEEEHKERREVVKKRKQLDGERPIMKCRNEERAIAIDGERPIVNCRNEERAIAIDGIVKCRNEIGGEEQKKRAIGNKRKHFDEEEAVVIRRNEIDDEEKEQGQKMRERVIVKSGTKNYAKELNGEKINSLPSQSTDLPEDLMEDILKRLAARELIRCSGMSKLWYNKVFNDPRFASSHLVHNQNKLSLFFDLYNAVVDNRKMAFYFRVEEDKYLYDDVSCMAALDLGDTYETVGYCNGLTCIQGETTDPNHKWGLLTVFNPPRTEQLGLKYASPTGCFYLCCGFGFDPLSQEYKAVVIFASETKEEFVCMVFTLGTNSWRTITTTTAEISLPPGSPPFRNPMLTRVSTKTSTLCGSDLLWRVTHNNSSSEMLLLFDLHSEEIQFIRFPTECALTLPPATVNEHPYLVVDHLLEFKGYPCIARSEKITISKSDHSEHRCVDQSSFCCCCCKVHMYMLKDKVKQVWIKGETFDVQIKDPEGLLPAPLCCYFETTTTSAITPPPTHVLAFSDQVILSWFNGESLIIYNLKKKLLEVVEVANTYSKYFRNKMNRLCGCIGDDNVYPADMCYQLRAQVENMLPLRTFIPEGAETSTYNSHADWECAEEENPSLISVTKGKNSPTIYTFGLFCCTI